MVATARQAHRHNFVAVGIIADWTYFSLEFGHPFKGNKGGLGSIRAVMGVTAFVALLDRQRPWAKRCK